MTNLNDWINPKYLKKLEINKIGFNFSKSKPFPNMILSDFLIKDKINKLKISLESIEYYKEDHDLYQFLRTVNFKHLENKFIKKFEKFIGSIEFISFIENLTGLKFQKKVFELHSLNFQNTHYLLCHDDQVQKRKVAFIIYLCEDFNENDCGQLELFNSNEKGEPTNISKSISPKFNQFALFEVSSKSFHQVAENLSNKERISIGAWFYDEEKNENK